MDRDRVDSTTSLGSLGDDDDQYFPELHSVPRHSPDDNYDDELNYGDDDNDTNQSVGSTTPSHRHSQIEYQNTRNSNPSHKPKTSKLPFSSLSSTVAQIAYGSTNPNQGNINTGLRKGTISTSVPTTKSSSSSTVKTGTHSSSSSSSIINPSSNGSVPSSSSVYRKLAKAPVNPGNHSNNKTYSFLPAVPSKSAPTTTSLALSQRRQPRSKTNNYTGEDNEYHPSKNDNPSSEASFVGGAHLSTLKYLNNSNNTVKGSPSPFYKNESIPSAIMDDIPLSSTTLPDNIFDLFDSTVPSVPNNSTSSNVLSAMNPPREITKTTLDDFLSSSTSFFPSSFGDTTDSNDNTRSIITSSDTSIENKVAAVGVTTLDDFLSPRPLITTAAVPSTTTTNPNLSTNASTGSIYPLPIPGTNNSDPPITQYSSTPITTISLTAFSQGNTIPVLRPPPPSVTTVGTTANRRITPTSSTNIPHPSQENVYGAPHDTNMNNNGSSNAKVAKSKIAQTVNSLQMKQQELTTLSANTLHGKSIPVGNNGNENFGSRKTSPSSSSIGNNSKRLSASKDTVNSLSLSLTNDIPKETIGTTSSTMIVDSTDPYADTPTAERSLSSHLHNRSTVMSRLSKDDPNRRTSAISVNGTGIIDSSNQSIEETDESETYENYSSSSSVPRKSSATSYPNTSSTITKINEDNATLSPPTNNTQSSIPSSMNTNYAGSKPRNTIVSSVRSHPTQRYHHSYLTATKAMNTGNRGCHGFINKQIYAFKEAFDLLPLPRYLGTVPVETHRLDWKELSYLLLCQRLEHYSTAYVRLAQARNAIIMEREQSVMDRRLRLQNHQQQQQPQRVSSSSSSSLRTVPLRDVPRERRPSITSTSSDSASVTPSLESSNIQSPGRVDNTSVTTGTDNNTEMNIHNRPLSIGTGISLTERDTTDTSSLPLPELPLRPPMESVWTMKFSPDGRFLAVAGGTDQGAVIRIWQVTVWNINGNNTTMNDKSKIPGETKSTVNRADVSDTVSLQRERTGSTQSTVSKTSEYSGSASKYDMGHSNSYSNKDIDNIVRKISQASTHTPNTVPVTENIGNNNTMGQMMDSSSSSSLSNSSVSEPSVMGKSISLNTPTLEKQRSTVSVPSTVTAKGPTNLPTVSSSSSHNNPSITSSSPATGTGAEAGTIPHLLANDLLTTKQPFLQPQPYREWLGHDAHIVDLSWSSTNLLLSASMDGFVRLWHVSRNECLHKFQHPDCVTSVAFLPTDESIFMTGCFDRKLRLWSLETGRVTIWQATSAMITAAAFSPDGKFAIAGLFDGTAILYVTDGLRFRATLDCRNRRGPFRHGKKVTGIEFTTNSSHALITTNDSRIRMIDLLSFRTVTKYVGLRNINMQVKATFDSTMDRIISGSEDGYVYLWRTRNDHYIPTINPRLSGYDWTRVRSYEKFMGKEGYQSLDIETSLTIEIIHELGVKRQPAITVAIFAPPEAVRLARPMEAIKEWGLSLLPEDQLSMFRTDQERNSTNSSSTTEMGKEGAGNTPGQGGKIGKITEIIDANHTVILTADSRGVIRIYEQGMDKERI